MTTINADTFITKGFPLSENFLIDHVSSGAYHYIMGKWTPNFSATIHINAASQTPLWKIAANLQLGSQNILEPLLKEFGGDLIIRSGFSASNLGSSFGIQVAGFQGNMFNLVPDLQKIANKASGLSLVQGSSSFVKIDFNQFSVLQHTMQSLPQISTVDLINNVITKELTAVKGFL